MSKNDPKQDVLPKPADLLTTDEAAAILRTTRRTMEDWRSNRTGPRFGRFGRQVLYRRADIEDYIEAAFRNWDGWQAS